MNYLEGIAFILLISLIAGISYPLYTFVAQVFYLIGRALYSSGYAKSGPEYRGKGVMLFSVASLAILVMSVKSSLNLLNSN